MFHLVVNGRRKQLSEQEIISILEKHYFHATATDVSFHPIEEGKWYPVIPRDIDASFFQEPRKEEHQEKIRKRILRALNDVKEKPKEYGRSFETMMPPIKGGSCIVVEWTLNQHKECARNWGDRMANMHEQTLELAQRIIIEGWKQICDKLDHARWRRAVTYGDNSTAVVIGGSYHVSTAYLYRSETPSTIERDIYFGQDYLPNDVVPLVMRYMK